MKFEQILRIYWTKSYLYGGLKIPFDVHWRRFGQHVKGIGFFTKYHIIKRFELHNLYYNPKATLGLMIDEERLSLNRLFSKMGSIYFQLTEINRLNIIRLFLIKSFRGKAQAFGKPSHGQRTWSNAWTAYLYNKELRTYISEIQKQLNKDKKEEKINYKLLKKKTNVSSNEGKLKDKTKKGLLWF